MMKRIDAIVLAAGLSRRMGEAKLLLPWGDTTVLGATLANVWASDVQRVVVVTGGYRQGVEQLIAQIAERDILLQETRLPPSIITVHNPNFATGEMLSSLKVGIGALAEDADGCVVLLGDMPLVLPETINQVVAALQGHHLVAPLFEGKRGHPVGFGRSHFTPLLNLPPNGAPRDLIYAYRHELHQLPLNTDSILIDLDTRAVYNQWRPR